MAPLICSSEGGYAPLGLPRPTLGTAPGKPGAVLDYQRSRLPARVWLVGYAAVDVIGRGAVVEPSTEFGQTRGEPPFGQHLQRHRARRAGFAARGETALEEPAFEGGGLWI